MRAEPQLIRSRDNAQVKRLLKLATSSRERRQTGTTILDGPHLVEAYARSGGTAEVLAVSETAHASAHLRRLFDEAPARARLLLADGLITKISQVVTSSGILAIVPTPAAQALPDSIGTCLVLEGIQDPGNLGSILRSAVAAGIGRVFLSAGSVFAWAPKVVRAGQGAHFFLTIHENVPLAEVARRVQGKIVATQPRARTSLFDCDLRGPVTWLFGNEAAGLSGEAGSLAQEQVRIPMPGKAESLNVAAAAAICLFEQIRQNAES